MEIYNKSSKIKVSSLWNHWQCIWLIWSMKLITHVHTFDICNVDKLTSFCIIINNLETFLAFYFVIILCPYVRHCVAEISIKYLIYVMSTKITEVNLSILWLQAISWSFHFTRLDKVYIMSFIQTIMFLHNTLKCNYLGLNTNYVQWKWIRQG